MNNPKRLLIIWHGALYPSYRKPFWMLQEHFGWEVHLLCARSWKKALPKKTKFQHVAPDSKQKENIHLHIHRPLLSFHGALFFFPFFPKVFADINPDVVYVIEEPFSLMGWWTVYWCKRHVPSVPVMLFSYQDIEKNYPPPFSWMEQFVYKYVDRLLVSNNIGFKTMLAKGFTKPLDVLPTAVNMDRFSYREPFAQDGLFTLGYVGRLANEKGIDTILWAMTEMDDGVRLRILGDGPARHRLELLAKELGVYHRVAFLKPVSHEELPEFYHDLDALILPSKTTPQWQEQFGRVLIEAMACGVPVIGSNSGAIPSVIADAGLTFPEGKWEQLCDKVQMIQRDFRLRCNLSLRGRVRVEKNYSAERVARQLNQHLLEVLSNASDDQRALTQ